MPEFCEYFCNEELEQNAGVLNFEQMLQGREVGSEIEAVHV